jgi:hypothetical protein
VNGFTLWQPDGLGHPVFLSEGAWHPLTLLAGAVAGKYLAALGTGICLFYLLRRRIVIALLVTVVLALQPSYGIALAGFAIASTLQCVGAGPPAGTGRLRAGLYTLTVAVAAMIGMLGTSTSTIFICIGAVVLGALFLTRRRAESVLAVFAALVSAALLAAPWWVPVVVVGRARAPSTVELGQLRDEGATRSLDLRRSAKSTFSSDRLAQLRSMAVAPSGLWRFGTPFLDYLGVRTIKGTPAGDVENKNALPRYFVPSAYALQPELRETVATLQRLTSFRDFAIVNHIPPKVSKLANGALQLYQPSVVAEVASVNMRSRSVVDIDSRGWNLLVSSEPWWEGWRMYWNGERMPPVIVNGAFLGMFVPPGRGTLELRYQPEVWDVGLRLSAVGLVFLIVTLLWPWHVAVASVASRIPPVGPLARKYTELIAARMPSLPAPPPISRYAQSMVRFAERWHKPILLLLLMVYAVVIISKRVDVAGGADSSGYLNQSRLWSAGRVVVPIRLAPELGLPVELQHAVIPLGFAPGPRPYTMVPFYPPGVPVQMALLRVFGGDAAPFFLAPLAAVITLLLFYRMARDLGLSSGWAACGVAILALCPTFILYAIQPMSDVVATCWAVAAMTCAFRGAKDWRFALLAGMCAGFGVLVRPTQILLLPAVALAIGMNRRSLAALVAGGLPFALAQMAINLHLYGDPLRTGYGGVIDGLRWSFFPTRFTHYAFWLAAVLSPIVFPIGLLGVARREFSPRLRLVLVAWFLPFFLFYCLYQPYETWWYTRFLLPAVPSLILSTLLLFGSLSGRRALIALTVVAVFLVELGFDRKLDAIGFGAGERVYTEAAKMARERIPANAVVLTMQQSGSLYYYNGTTSLRYDAMTPAIFNTIRAPGRPLYALVSDWEVPELRAKTASRWTPVADVRRDVFLFIYTGPDV